MQISQMVKLVSSNALSLVKSHTGETSTTQSFLQPLVDPELPDIEYVCSYQAVGDKEILNMRRLSS
jgi:hypothetical protein